MKGKYTIILGAVLVLFFTIIGYIYYSTESIKQEENILNSELVDEKATKYADILDKDAVGSEEEAEEESEDEEVIQESKEYEGENSTQLEAVKKYSFEDIINVINNSTENYKDNMSVYYYNFETGDKYCFNEDVKYLSASLKKLPQVMEVIDRVSNGEFTLDTTIEYNPATDYSNGTGILQFEKNIGSRTIQELVDLAILESDNIAFNMLRRFCNYDLVQYMIEITGDSSIEDEEYIKLTAQNNYDILYQLYTNPNKNPYYGHVLDLMKKTAFHDRLDKYLPHDKVAHKIGSYFRYYHDIGIVFGEEDYILIVLSKDIGELTDDPEFLPDSEERYVVDMGDEACDLIANLSKDIYEIINK